MKNPASIICTLLLAACSIFLSGCHCTHCCTCCREAKAPYRSFYDLNQCGMRIGYVPNCRSGNLAQRIYNHATLVPSDSIADLGKALLREDVDAAVYDDFPLQELDFIYNGRFELVPGVIDESEAVVAVAPGCTNLLQELNTYIADYRADGTYDQVLDIWVFDPDRGGRPPKVPTRGRLLRVGTDADEIPNSFFSPEGELQGFDVEFICRFAAKYGYRVDFVLKPIDELFVDLREGRLDAVVDNIDDESSVSGVLLSNGYEDTGIRVLVKRKEIE